MNIKTAVFLGFLKLSGLLIRISRPVFYEKLLCSYFYRLLCRALILKSLRIPQQDSGFYIVFDEYRQ